MDASLTSADLELLIRIKTQGSPALNSHSGLPRLFGSGLALIKHTGEIGLTRAGERLLFQKECCTALEAIEAGRHCAHSTDTIKWLTSAGFIVQSDEPAFSITRRGAFWLRSVGG